jgi:hypothetical protein
MAVDMKYCYKCGSAVPKGATFCSECGASLNLEEEKRAEYTATSTSASNNADLGIVPMMMIIYGVLAVIGSIFIISLGMAFDQMLQMLRESGMSEADIRNVESIFGVFAITNKISATGAGLVLAISGIFAVIGGMKADKRTGWKGTVLITFIAALIPAFAIPFMPLLPLVLIAIGLIVAYWIYSSKDKFLS